MNNRKIKISNDKKLWKLNNSCIFQQTTYLLFLLFYSLHKQTVNRAKQADGDREFASRTIQFDLDFCLLKRFQSISKLQTPIPT